MCCGFFGGGGEDGTPSAAGHADDAFRFGGCAFSLLSANTLPAAGHADAASDAGHAAAVLWVLTDDFCGEEVEAVNMADFTEASDRCTSDISNSSFRSECNNHNRNDEIRSLKSKFRRQKAESKEQKSVQSICCAYNLYRISACTLKIFRRFVYLYRNISPYF